MRIPSPMDDVALRTQIERQRKYAWNIDSDIPWQLGVDLTRPLLPLDADALVFPGASEKQRLALSHYFGLVINATIAEMEAVIVKLKQTAWVRLLNEYPANPEMETLGELFFEEELKHSEAFRRYNHIYCQYREIDPKDLEMLLPSSFGSLFLFATIWNSKHAGNSFWWVVGVVEEVALRIYEEMHPWSKNLDPLYFAVHRRHLEEESRHHNYAFMVLELVSRTRMGPFTNFRNRFDLLWAQAFCSGWVLGELNKFFEVDRLKRKHPFFWELAECIPLVKRNGPFWLLKKLFINAPYLSTVLNSHYHPKTVSEAKRQGLFSFPMPDVHPRETQAG